MNGMKRMNVEAAKIRVMASRMKPKAISIKAKGIRLSTELLIICFL